MTPPDLWFTRATLRRDAPDVAPLINTLMAADGADCDPDAAHRLLWTLMPPAMQAEGKPARPSGADRAAFLWRRAPDGNGPGTFYLLGPRPRADSAFFTVETKPWAPVFTPGRTLAFDLLVNATVDRQLDPEKGRGGRQRIDVVADALRQAASAGAGDRPRGVGKDGIAREALAAWLAARGPQNGFRLAAPPVLVHQDIVIPGRGRGRTPKLGVARLTGLIEVTGPDAFAERLATGFGRAKAFGYGLMLLKRPGLS